MYDEDFKYYLADKLDMDLETVLHFFEKEEDVFKIALMLIDEHGIDKSALGKIWGDFLGFAYVDPNTSIVSKEYLDILGKDFVLEYNALPLYKFGKAVTVCTSNPKTPYIQDKVEKKLGEIVSFVFCFPFDIELYLQFLNFKKSEE